MNRSGPGGKCSSAGSVLSLLVGVLMVKAEISSNQWYGAINRRFDRRARLLSRLGYKYTGTPFGAMFVRSRFCRIESIAAGVVMNAHNRAFVDAIRSPMRSRLEELEGLADHIRSRVERRASSMRSAS